MVGGLQDMPEDVQKSIKEGWDEAYERGIEKIMNGVSEWHPDLWKPELEEKSKDFTPIEEIFPEKEKEAKK